MSALSELSIGTTCGRLLPIGTTSVCGIGMRTKRRGSSSTSSRKTAWISIYPPSSGSFRRSNASSRQGPATYGRGVLSTSGRRTPMTYRF